MLNLPSCRAISGTRLQSNDGNFRRAAETERQVDRTDASIDVELHSVAQPEKSLHVSGSHFREQERGQERDTNLASVSVTGENQGNLASDNMVSVIGFVCQQDKRFLIRIPARRESGGEVGPRLQYIRGAGEPQAPAVAINGY